MRSAVSLRGRVAWEVRGCERGASAVGCGAGAVEGARRYLAGYLPDDLDCWITASPPSNECALHLEREVPFTVGRPRRVRGRVEVFRLLVGVDEG